MDDYRTIRKRIYENLRQEGIFTWDYMYGQEYALADIHPVSRSVRDELSAAAERLGRLIGKTVEIIRQGDDTLFDELGVPAAARNAARISIVPGLATAIGRFDFAYTADGVKMLEFNSDTPTGIVEAYYVNGKVCEAFGRQDPNAGMTGHIREAFRQMEAAYESLGYAMEHRYFSALDWHEEDASTARFLQRHSGWKGEFVPLAALRVFEDRLQVWNGLDHRPVDLLYRLHAIEKLAEEKDEDGYPTGEHVLDLIARRQLGIVNPPSGFLAQTKALQALIWSLHESGDFYTEEEQDTVRRYMLPTYLENRFEGTGIPYVAKPIFGREGGGVSIFGANGALTDRDTEEFYWDQPMVYQQLAELPRITVQTVSGPYEGHLLWGTFLMGGRASAILARVGERITGNLSFYVPVALEDD